MSEVQASAQSITFQSKFAARKAQEDKSFMDLVSGSAYQNRDHKVSGDLRHHGPLQNQTNQSTLTHDGSWDKQRLTATQNVGQHSSGTMAYGATAGAVGTPYGEPARQSASTQNTPQGHYQPSYAGRRLVGSSSNSAFSQNRPGFGMDSHGHQNYRAALQNQPVAQSLNYDDKASTNNQERYQVSAVDRLAQSSHDFGRESGLRGKSTDAADSRYNFGLGQESVSNQNGTNSGLASQKLNGNATYDRYNFGRPAHGFTDAYRSRAGRNHEGSLEQLHSRERTGAGVSGSMSKPTIGTYGYSAGQTVSRRLDYVPPSDARAAAPFDMQNQFGRNNSNKALTNDFAKGTEKYDFGRGMDLGKKVDNTKAAEVTDGYTEYFSQGCDYCGQLGHGQDPSQHDRNRHVATPKSLSFDILIKAVSCGGAHTLILSRQGELFSIGSNEYGQLGLNDRQLTFTTAPLLIQEIQSRGLQVKQMASGQSHSLILTDNGQIFAWGSNIYGQCGLGKQMSDQNSPRFVQGDCDMNRVYTPRRVPIHQVSSYDVKSIASGENFSGFLTNDGLVYTFGDNSEGQLGVGTTQSNLDEPHKVKCDEKISQISLGFQHMLLLTFSGRVLAVGRNREHQLGLGPHQGVNADQSLTIPMRIDSIRDTEVLKVVAGGFSAALIQNAYNRQLLVWGQGDFGIFDKPQKLYMDDIDFTDIEISKFSTNSPFAAALDKAGKVYSWGSNTLGQLGHGDQRVRKLPTQIQSLKRKTITQMSIGHNFVVMLGRDVSQEEQQKKKLKRKMQKEAKEKERQQKKQVKLLQDENKRPRDLKILSSKERLTDFDRRDSNQPATPKLPGESSRESMAVRSAQESQARARPKSAHNHNAVKNIIDEMEKISNKGQGLLERCKNLKEAQQNELMSGRSPYSREPESALTAGQRSLHPGDDQRLLHSTQYGPAKSASFGDNELAKDDGKDKWAQDYNRTSSHYLPKYTDVKSDHRSLREDRTDNPLKQSASVQQNIAYRAMTQESIDHQRYRDEIEDLRRQLKQAQDTSIFEKEITDLKLQLQKADLDNKQLRDENRNAAHERDQEVQASKNYAQDQTRQIQEYQDLLYQKDSELGNLRNELSDQRTENLEAKQTAADQENKIRQIEGQYDQLKSSYESKLAEVDQEKLDLGKELDEAANKNQQLMTIVKQKQVELHETQKIADQAKTMKKQLVKLEEIIDDLQSKNKELNELLNRKMIERAESYKKQVVDFLNKPKQSYEVEKPKDYSKPQNNNQYRQLGQDLDRDQMTYVKADKDAHTRKSYNDRSYRDYRLDNNFASEYGKNIAVNNSVSFPERAAGDGNLLMKQQHNSEKKRAKYRDCQPDGIDDHRTQEAVEQSDRQFYNHQPEQKTRSVPRYSKINRNNLASSPFFQGDDHHDRLQEGGEIQMEHSAQHPANQLHSAATVDRRDEVKSEYQRRRQGPVGQSVDGLVRNDATEVDPSKDDFRSRTKYEGKSNDERSDFASAHFRDERKPYYEQSRPDQQLRTDDLVDDSKYPRIVSSTYPGAVNRDLTGDRDGSRSRIDADVSVGRPPLTGHRMSEKDREPSGDRRHSRVRSGHNVPVAAQSSSQFENPRLISASQNLNDSHNLSRRGNDDGAGYRSSYQRSNSERRSSVEQVANQGQQRQYAGGLNYSNRDGSLVGSRDGLSGRSRDYSRGGGPAAGATYVHTAQSKTRKEYVDITDCSDQSDRNRKVHRIDLAQDDQEDIQKQIQEKLSRIQKIFKGQQQRHVENGIEQPASGLSMTKLNDDDTSLNDRISQPTKERTHLETNSFNGRPTNGSKTPVSNHQPSSLADLNDKDGGYHRMSSNPAAAIRTDEDYSKISQGYDSGVQHQRRQSLSHNHSSYAREPEVPGSRGNGADERASYHKGIGPSMHGDQFNGGQNFSRPGAKRYSQDDQQEFSRE